MEFTFKFEQGASLDNAIHAAAWCLELIQMQIEEWKDGREGDRHPYVIEIMPEGHIGVETGMPILFTMQCPECQGPQLEFMMLFGRPTPAIRIPADVRDMAEED